MKSSRSTMRAIRYDGQLEIVKDHPLPLLKPDWALIRVQKAGICRTDLEILKGYKKYSGILGHEFSGIVEDCDVSKWIGEKVVGEINVGCKECYFCLKGIERHCSHRKVLGILNLDGCMADYCSLPVNNLFKPPISKKDSKGIWIEPLSSALEILEQLQLNGSEKAVVLGDGCIGILCSWVLSTVLTDITLIGHHLNKIQIAKWNGVETKLESSNIKPTADIVVDATGSSNGLNQAISHCRPRGTIIAKTTIAHQSQINLSKVVVNEINLIGSRCGRFEKGIKLIQTHENMPLESLITATYELEQAKKAFEHASQPEALKIVINV